MKKYFSLFRIRMSHSLQYRAAVFGAIATRFLWAMMEILAFAALYRSGYSQFPMEFSQTVSYLWMQQALYTVFCVVFGDAEIYNSILDGSIAYELTRPMNLYNRWFCQAAASRLSPSFLEFLPILPVALLIPAPYNLTFPGFVPFLLFLLSVVLGLGVVVACAMLMYVALFYTISHRGIKIIVIALTTFLSGGIIPLPFFPEPIRTIVQVLPFSAMQNIPLQIFSGTITGVEIYYSILFQLFWLAVLILFGKIAMQHALERVVVQGG